MKSSITTLDNFTNSSSNNESVHRNFDLASLAIELSKLHSARDYGSRPDRAVHLADKSSVVRATKDDNLITNEDTETKLKSLPFNQVDWKILTTWMKDSTASKLKAHQELTASTTNSNARTESQSNIILYNLSNESDQVSLNDVLMSEGIFAPNVINKHMRQQKITHTWTVDGIYRTSRLPADFFIDQLLFECRRWKAQGTPSKVFIKRRLLPIVHRARENPTSYDLLSLLYTKGHKTEAKQILKWLSYYSNRKDIHFSFFNAYNSLLPIMTVAELSEALSELRYNTTAVKAIKRLVPNIPNNSNPVTWILERLPAVTSESEVNARSMIFYIIIHIAVASNLDIYAAAMTVKLLKYTVDDSSLISVELMRLIMDNLLSKFNDTRSLAVLKIAVILWSELRKLDIELTRSQQLQLMESALSFTQSNGSSNEGVSYHSLDPNIVLDMILESTSSEDSIPVSFYISVISRNLEKGSIAAAIRYWDSLVARYYYLAPADISLNLVARMIKACSKKEFFKKAEEIVSSLDKFSLTDADVFGAVLNFCTRTGNLQLAEKMISLMHTPIPRSLLREMLFLYLRFGNQKQVDVILNVIAREDSLLTDEEAGMLMYYRILREGLPSALEYARTLDDSNNRSAWSIILDNSMRQRNFDAVLEALKHVAPDSYYYGIMIFSIGVRFGSSRAKKMLESIVEKSVVEKEPLSRSTITREFPLNEQKLEIKETTDLIMGNMAGDTRETEFFTKPETTRIPDEMFLVPTEEVYKSYLKRVNRLKKNRSLQQSKWTNLLNKLESDEKVNEFRKRNLKSIDSGPDVVTFEILARLALFEFDAPTYNWAILSMERMGVSVIDIENMLSNALIEARESLNELSYGQYSRKSRQRSKL
ncbi:hypothetical protein V1511DRAFT_511853 [Dipodascopsis uninucleata]